MTYQRFSAAVVSVVISVIIWPLPCDERDDVLEHGVPERDVDPDDEADREDQDGQVPDMLARRPRDLAELGPDFVEIAADASHVCGCFSGYGKRQGGEASILHPLVLETSALPIELHPCGDGAWPAYFA